MNSVQRFSPAPVIGDELAKVLSDEIIFLKYAPGARVVEDDICARFGLSRSPVREALRLLEGEGLAVRSARRGVRIAPMSLANLTEVYACREALEGLTAFEAAQNVDKKTLQDMELRLAGMKGTKDSDQVEQFFEQNVAFTNLIHLASGNHTLQRLLRGIERQSLRYRFLAHLKTHKMLELSYRGQRSIYEAISSNRPSVARDTAVRVIREAFEIISEVVAEFYPTQPSAKEARDLIIAM
jgi:DNA-binding GntR family transcriptional regulator